MATDKFRRQLQKEARLWQNEGLISSECYDQLADRYQFANLETVARNRFAIVLILIGSLLMGLGVITFVAANWQDWGRNIRVVLLLLVFVTLNVSGFYVWQRSAQQSWQSMLGRGLLLAGSLSLGANMALMAQMFHISGAEYKLYLTWGFGVLLMAYSLRLPLLGICAIALTGIGYWTGLGAVDMDTQDWLWHLLIQCMPIVASIAYLPLAYWGRSPLLFGCSVLAIISTVFNNFGLTPPASSQSFPDALRNVIALIVMPAWLWSYRHSWSDIRFITLCRKLSILLLIILGFFLSFFDPWLSSYTPEVSWFHWLNLSFFTTWAGYNCYKQIQADRSDLTNSTVLAILGVMALVMVWHGAIVPIPVVATFIFNALLFILGAGLAREGLLGSSRLQFWSGLLLLGLQIFSRTFEYDTALILKSLIFILCGLGIITAGIWFEKYIRCPNPPIQPNQP